MHGRFGDPNHRPPSQLPSGVEAGVAEAGDHVAVSSRMLTLLDGLQ